MSPETHASIFRGSFVFLITIASTLVQLPRLGLAADERYANCGSLTCGNKTVAYPLWISGTEDYCGHPSYELQCQEENLVATIMSRKYRVLDIVSEKQSLTMVRMDLLENICPRQQGDFVLDYSLFNYTSGDRNATFIYDCNPAPSDGNHVFNCSMSNGSLSQLWVTTSDYSSQYDYIQPSCSTNVSVPILKSSFSDLLSNTTDAGQALKNGFEVKWTLGMEDCRDCTSSGGRCGYNTTTKKFSCFCSNGAYGSTCEAALADVPAYDEAPAPEALSSKSNVFIRIGEVGGAIVLSMLTAAFVCKVLKPMLFKWKSDRDIENFIKQNGSLAPERFSYSQVKRMTNSFTGKLGEGGFGAVYSGELPDGTLVAVKLLNASKGNGEEFINEVASISRTSHINIVTLLGFCYEGDKRALIYEFMPNGSLDKFIADENAMRDGMGLGWEKLHQIAVGIARGLEYLHKGCSTRILHFDIKPQNILLDEELCPKISDFGMSKLCINRESIVSVLMARGTIGYIAPEVFSRNFGEVSHKSDVYSYGMLLLEMVGGGKKNKIEADQSSEMYFHDEVYQLIEEGHVQELYGHLTEEDKQTARKMALVGIWCIQEYPIQRPSMGKVIEMLEGSVDALLTPPKPCLSSTPRPPRDSLSISVSI